MGHQCARLRPRNKGKIARGAGNDKGLAQRGPLSAYLLIMYAGSMMEYYENDLIQETIDNMNSAKL